MAEAVRFELTNGCPLPVFKTGAIDHSATPPDSVILAVSDWALAGQVWGAEGVGLDGGASVSSVEALAAAALFAAACCLARKMAAGDESA